MYHILFIHSSVNRPWADPVTWLLWIVPHDHGWQAALWYADTVSSEYIASSGTDVTLNSNYLVVFKFIFTIVQEAIIF